MNGTPYSVPDVSRDLLPNVIDRLAEEKPDDVFISFSTGKSVESVSFRQFAGAIDRTAWWLENELGKGRRDQGVAYFGTGGGDIRYMILLIAAVKAGHYMLFNSPRNSIDAHRKLFAHGGCKTLVLPEQEPHYVAAILNAYPLQTLRLPNLDELLIANGPKYTYRRSFEEARRDPLVALHTSGSTGLPKPIIWTLATASIGANAYQAPGPGAAVPLGQVYRFDLVLSAMPLFHAAGLLINLLSTVYSGHKVVLGPPGPLLGADTAISLIKSTGATTALLPPSTLDEIGKRPELLEALNHVNYILGAGGMVTKAAGEAIITKTKLINILGSTELGALSQKEIDAEDWEYMQFNPSSGVEFRHFSGDEYELVVKRNEELARYQVCFDLFPYQQEVSSHDLFSKHPSKPDLWMYRGRSDDVLGFLNGENTNPTGMEGLISSRPEVRGALVVGQGRFEAALLIEPSKSGELSVGERAALTESLWPTIEEANRQCPAHARVSKSHILFTTTQKPMARAGKGTVQRKLTIENYAAEIDALYANADNMRDNEALDGLIEGDIQDTILQILQRVSGTPNFPKDEDIFTRGIDSLQVIQIVRYLKHALGKDGVTTGGLAPSTVYMNATPAKLSAALQNLEYDTYSSNKMIEESRERNMKTALEQYSFVHQANEERGQKQVVVLTGSTGNLGSYLLDTLLKSPLVSKIYCLNRSAGSEHRQLSINKSRGLHTDWNAEQVIFLQADLTKNDFGLGQDKFIDLSEEVDLIIHNAWKVDFNLAFESYVEDHIRSVRGLIDLSLRSSHRTKIFFVSSIASVSNWPAHYDGPVPERVINDFAVPQALGYGESKHVAERLLATMSSSSIFQATICRVGQVAGPVRSHRGLWNPRDWFPSLIKSSQYLGCIPNSLGTLDTVNWLPIDLLCPILTDLALSSGSGSSDAAGVRVFHTVNPHTTSWSTLVPYVRAKMKPEVQTVSLASWVKKLRASAVQSTKDLEQDLKVNPALKLMDFFEGLISAGTKHKMATLETTKTERSSTALSNIGPVTGDWISRWMDQWETNLA